MKLKMIAMIAVSIFAVGSMGTSALAQGCGCGAGGVAPGSYGSYGGFGGVGYDSTCGRAISSSQAASLWSGYCTDNCAYTGPQRQGLFGRHGGCGLKNRLHGGGGGCGGGGCFGGGGFNQGCFGYPNGGCGCGSGGGLGSIGSYSTCGCGGGSSCGSAGGCGCGLKRKLAGLHSRGQGRSSCGAGGCLRGGCGVKGRFFNKALARHTQNSYAGFATTDSCSSCSYLSSGCDTCGNNGGYFDQAIGYEYGNAGMQSCVSGCLTGACGGGCGCGN